MTIMTPRQTTQAVLLLAFLLLGAYDAWAFFRWGRPYTLSVVLYESAHEHPIVAFGLGVLAGHLFWPVKE